MHVYEVWTNADSRTLRFWLILFGRHRVGGLGYILIKGFAFLCLSAKIMS